MVAKNPEAITLAAIAAAGDKGLFTSPECHLPLVAQGLVEINAKIFNPAGEIATRVTQKGIESMNDVCEVKTGFVIEQGVDMPAITTRGRSMIYPFDKLEIGESFFVAKDSKKLASTVSSAAQRFATPDPEGKMRINRKGSIVPVMVESRKFSVRSVEGGSRIWRIA